MDNMELAWVKELVEKEGVAYENSVDSMPHKFIDSILMQGVKIDHIERGRLVCSFTVPPRLMNTGSCSLHGGATAALVDLVGSAVIFTMGAPSSGVSIDNISVSYLEGAQLGEEVEIAAKVLRVGKVAAVVSVELRKKMTGKIIAHGRHTKYLRAASNKM